MANFKFKKEKDVDNKFDLTTVIVSVDHAEHILDVVVPFKEFLLACGYAESTIKEFINTGDDE